ncbi:Oidioi.mRNA.OKI2018_I69.chr2.g5064.t1.cds [Oikopleura dioica]|uniref:Oidioi.mRNA.OKI2018_I69.chr2.g5064.t1.cds n=1 Tax=Oikopleura dioica TaxID=34765 RepID=A0ABN7SZ16_OIKDI|nr:Oidioi.mRNA.OKI2018_I69.chr2.g5064.t1.cds [Oikopleura dioica]
MKIGSPEIDVTVMDQQEVHCDLANEFDLDFNMTAPNRIIMNITESMSASELKSTFNASLVVDSEKRVGGEVNVKIEPTFYGDYKFAKCFQDHKNRTIFKFKMNP